MNKPFTELPAPAKERLIIRLHTTTVLEPDRCEQCHMPRVPGAGETRNPPMCDVCGRLLCRGCYGKDGTLPGPGLSQVNICDDCAELNIEEIGAIIELRAKLSQP